MYLRLISVDAHPHDFKSFGQHALKFLKYQDAIYWFFLQTLPDPLTT